MLLFCITLTSVAKHGYQASLNYKTNHTKENLNVSVFLLQTRGVTLGQRENLSRKDVQKIRHMYKCR